MKTTINQKWFLKASITGLIVLILTSEFQAQTSVWSGSGTSADTDRQGKVRIGPAATQNHQFEVETSTNNDGIYLKNTGGNAVISMDCSSGTGQAWTLNSDPSGYLMIKDGSAQDALVVDINNNVGIGTNPSCKLMVGSGVIAAVPRVGLFEVQSNGGGFENYAVQGNNLIPSAVAGTNVGVYGNSDCSTGSAAIGVKGEATSSGNDCFGGWFVCNGTPGNFNVGVSGLIGFAGTSGNVNAAVLGDANGYTWSTNGAFAGYFLGDVFRSGTDNFTSDRKLKENIQPLTNSLDKIMKLKPSSYTYKTKEFSLLSLPVGKQMGLIAQDLEKVFPELVHEMKGWTKKDKTGVEKTVPDFKSVQYISLIPVLIGAIQDQQNIINDLKSEMSTLKGARENTSTGLNNLGVTEETFFLDNVPNPFSTETTIKYSLPVKTQTAYIGIYDLSGKLISKHEITQMGSSGLKVSAESLSAGIYVYSLVADGKLIDTKRMIVGDK